MEVKENIEIKYSWSLQICFIVWYILKPREEKKPNILTNAVCNSVCSGLSTFTLRNSKGWKFYFCF